MFKKKNKKNIFHQELIEQIEGLINIDIGSYIYNLAPKLKLHMESFGGLDIYIYDEDFAFLDEYKKICFKTPYWLINDKSMIGHYHSEDLLWLIINYDKEKKKMIEYVNKYINWKKENYNEESKK